MDKRDKRRMLDRLIELRDRYDRLTDDDVVVVLRLDAVPAFVADRWATPAGDEVLAAESAIEAPTPDRRADSSVSNG